MAKSETAHDSPTLEGLVRLSHHRWLVPVVAEIARSRGARFAVLAKRLEVSAPSLRRVLAAAQGANLVLPNPGYGHPLRPEYLLTPWGEAIAQQCDDVVTAARVRDWPELVAHKWTLPVLAAVHTGCQRYGQVAQALPTATPRVVASALQDLTEAGCITRTVVDDRPPRPVYSVARPGLNLAEAAVRLATASSPLFL